MRITKQAVKEHLEDWAPLYFPIAVGVICFVGMPALFGLAARYPNHWLFRVRPTNTDALGYKAAKKIMTTVRDFGR